MNKFPSTMRIIPTLAAVTIGLFATGAVAQNYLQGEPGEAPGVSQDGRFKFINSGNQLASDALNRVWW